MFRIIFIWTLFMLLQPCFLSAQHDTIKLYKGDKTKWINSLSELKSGLRYKIQEQGTGKKPRPGDMIAVHYIGVLSNDSVFDNSYKRGEPLMFDYGVGQVIKGWDEGIGLLRKGGKALLVVPPELGYGNQEVMGIPPGSTLFFQVELMDVQRNENLKPYDTKNKDTISTSDGIQYIVVDSGYGKQPDTASWAYLHYTGYLPGGKIFDASVLRDEPVRINPGAKEVIPAWDEIVQLMKPGARFHVIVPPEMGYGEKGLEGIVPPNTPLRFDMELLHVSEKREIKPFDVSGKDTVKLASGLQYIPVADGKGDYPEDGAVVKIHFTGYFKNGEMFQSSLKTDDAVIFAVGEGQVIEGLDEAVKHVRPGGKIRAIIPSKLGYGKEGNLPAIPPEKDLIFDIEVMSIVR